jgi:hypothetical protein
MSKWVGAIIGLIAVLVGVAIFVEDDASEPQKASPGGTTIADNKESVEGTTIVATPPQRDANGSADGKQEASEVDAADGPTPSRQVIERETGIKGVVVTLDGEPIANARVSLTPIPRSLSELPADYQSFKSFAEAHSNEVATDAAGHFRLELVETALPDLGFIVWLSHSRYEPRYILLSADNEQWVQDYKYELQEAAPESAVVIDQSGKKISGALIEQFGINNSAETAEKEFDSRLAWLLKRSMTTNENGMAELQILPGWQEIRGSMDELRSSPWIGEVTELVTLELKSTISVAGTIERFEGVDSTLELSIKMDAIDGARLVPLGDFRTALDHWESLELPFIAGAAYRFRLEASGVVATEFFAYPGQVGEHLEVRLDARLGRTVWFFVGDTEENPLAEAEATFEWKAGGRVVTKTMKTHPDYEGYIALDGCPDGVLKGEFRCVGYETEILPALIVPAPDEVSLVIELRRGVGVKGVCLLDGKPVRDFELSVWPLNQPSHWVQHRFSDREDGSFEIDGARLTDVMLVAGIAGLGVSNIARIDTRSGNVEGVVLNIQIGSSAVGQVLDFSTGLPIPTATVQPLFADVKNSTGAIGARLAVNPEGHFQLNGLQNGGALVEVAAAGYSTVVVPVMTRVGVESDFGSIRLSKRKPLGIKVEVSPGVDVTQFSVFIYGNKALGRYAPDAGGTIEFESFESGSYSFHLITPEGIDLNYGQYLEPQDERWDVVLDATGSSSLTIEVKPESEKPLPAGLSVRLTRFEGNGDGFYITKKFDPNELIQMPYLESGHYQALLKGGPTNDHSILAKQTVDLGVDEQKLIQFEIGDQARKFLVVDAEGIPIEGANVVVSEPGGNGRWSGVNLTDSEGKFVVYGYTAPNMIVHLTHADHGNHLGIKVALGSVDETMKLVLDGTEDVTFELRDRAGPIVGVQTILHDSELLYGLGSAFTDSQGKQTWRDLAKGPYAFHFDVPGYRELFHYFDVPSNSTPIQITALRHCGLWIETVTNGLPRPNIAFDLALTEAGWDASRELQINRISADQNELRTGSNGKIHLNRLPEGKVTWRVWLDDGQIYDSIEISPGTDNVLRIEVP